MIWEAATLFLWLLKDRGINSAYFVIIQCSNWGDVSVESIHEPGMIKIYLKRSKTDQLGRGADVIAGKTGRLLCPVAAVLAYMMIQGSTEGLFTVSALELPPQRPRQELRIPLYTCWVDGPVPPFWYTYVPLENYYSNNLQEVSNSITIGQIIKLLLYSKLLIEMMLVIYTQKGGIGEVV